MKMIKEYKFIVTTSNVACTIHKYNGHMSSDNRFITTNLVKCMCMSFSKNNHDILEIVLQKLTYEILK